MDARDDPFKRDGWDDKSLVHAGGGLVTRPRRSRYREFVVIHRPRYDDWTLPKGKLAAVREPPEGAALREVEEETGLRCRLVRPVGSTRYVDHRGRKKVVRYWEMMARGGRFAANGEVDEMRWVTIRQAMKLLTYSHDRRLVRLWSARRPLEHW